MAPALTEAESEALRAYWHDLDRQAALWLGVDPDTICPECGGDLGRPHSPDSDEPRCHAIELPE